MTTATDYRAIAEMLCATLHDTTTTTTLDDGRRVRVSIEPDPFGGFGDEQDFYGESRPATIPAPPTSTAHPASFATGTASSGGNRPRMHGATPTCWKVSPSECKTTS